MAEKTIFSKIIDKEIPAKIVYQDSLVTAFHDINPRSPVHILIIPNVLIPTVNDIDEEQHADYLSRMLVVAAKIAKMFNIDAEGYRLVINCNKNGRQEVFHLHMHLLGGKDIGPMVSN